MIDFDEAAVLEEAVMVDYKRDGNALWRWTAVLANCGASAQWENNADKMKASKPELLKCLADNWQVDKELSDAMGKLADADIDMTEDQRVGPLFRTEFVKEHLPPLTPRFRWSGSAECRSWDAAKWSEVKLEAKFAAHFRCDTVPTFAADPVKACATHASMAACFSIRPDVFWACGAGLDPRVPCVSVGLPVPEGAALTGHNYDGACLMPEHHGYKYAMAYEGEAGDPLEPPVIPPEKPATTTTTTPPGQEGGQEGGAMLSLIKVAAVIGSAVLVFILFKQATQARTVQAVPETEMNQR